MINIGSLAPEFDGVAIISGRTHALRWEQVHRGRTLVLLFDSMQSGSNLLREIAERREAIDEVARLAADVFVVCREPACELVSAAIPIPLIDDSACEVATLYGMLQAEGTPLWGHCIIDADGQPTTDPRRFYSRPPGALLPFGGHKGYGLSVITEIFAEALTGNGCCETQAQRLCNGMLSIVFDPKAFPTDEKPFASEVRRLIEFGASPRASINLILAGRALAFLRGREYALPVDVRDLAFDVIRHRLVLSYEALAGNVSADDVLNQLVPAVPMPEVSLAEDNRGERVFASR